MVISLHRLDRVARGGVNGRVGAQALSDVRGASGTGSTTITRAPMPMAAAADDEADGAAARDHDGLRSVGSAVPQHGIVAAGERLDQRAFGVVHGVGQLVQPFGARGEIFAVGAIHREAEVVDALGRVDDALADDAVAALEAR